MGKAGERAERVRDSRRSLHCDVCGAGNRLSAHAREHGWFRCAHCGDASPVPGVGDFAVTAPGGRVTRVVRPGSSEFETDGGFVIPYGRCLIGVALANLAVGGVLHFVERSDPGLAATLGPLLVGQLALAGLLVLFFGGTRQRLAVRDGCMESWWVSLGVPWRHRRIETERFHTLAYTRGRTGVEVRAPGGRLFVGIDRPSVGWLDREIIEAGRDARRPATGGRVACPGCGGPVADEKDLRSAGGIECPHCHTGLLLTGGGIAMPPARVTYTEPAAGERTAPRRDGEDLLWSAPPWRRFYPVAAPVNVVTCAALIAALVGGSWWATFTTPILEVVVGGVALAVTWMTLSSFPDFLVWIFGRHEFRLDAHALGHEVRVGPWTVRRHRIPFSRLVELEARRVEPFTGKESRPAAGWLVARTATASFEIRLLGWQREPILRDVVAATPARLEAVGREVRLDVRRRDQ